MNKLFLLISGFFFLIFTSGNAQIPQKAGDLDEVLSAYFEWGEYLGKEEEKKAIALARKFLRVIKKENYDFVFSPDPEEFNQAFSLVLQRKLYSKISSKMRLLVSKSEQLDMEIYVYHHPEANEGEGAIWLSEEEKPFNPYFSKKEKKQGKLMETIKPIFR
jgi:hypothetical protein